MLLCPFAVVAQTTPLRPAIEINGRAATGNTLPFWFTHNQLGRYTTHSSWQQSTEAIIEGTSALNGKLTWSYGTDLILLFDENGADPRIIQAYAGLSGKTLVFRLGAFADDELLGGLSTSNGNLLRSRNSRPYPMARLSTTGFIPLFFARDWLRVKAEYDEGLLPGRRVVDRPHLHHKSLTFEILTGRSFRIRAGIDHYVFWGGTLPDGEKLASDLKSYFRYILGKSGNSSFSESDQANVVGSQLGAYQLSFHQDFEPIQVQLLISHPFEDRSGMELANAKDNLYTLHFRKKQQGALLDEWLVEYLYTKNQSGSVHDNPTPETHKRGRDNYFNHDVYQTGFSYFGYSMGTPLFSPLIRNDEGVLAGFANNRLTAFHMGAKGFVSKQLGWKAMLTWSRNFGTYHHPYQTVQKQFCSFGELTWSEKNLPLSFSATLAIDAGKQTGDHTGLGLSMKWQLK